MTKPKAPFHWPLPGEARKPVSKDQVCAHGGFSHAHHDRLQDAPKYFKVGERLQRSWSSEWDVWFANRPQVTAAKPAPTAPELPESPRRRARRARKPVTTTTAPAE
jgi:hypothetical protein